MPIQMLKAASEHINLNSACNLFALVFFTIVAKRLALQRSLKTLCPSKGMQLRCLTASVYIEKE
eukprot:scaffold193004_cov15-Tisochrysis_lutea.AAC.1